jgi:hypothetical protein
MKSNTSSVGKIAMAEVLELFLMTVEIEKKLGLCAMIDVPQDTKDLVLTAIRFVLMTSRIKDSSAEMQNMEEEVVILGSSVMDLMIKE